MSQPAKPPDEVFCIGCGPGTTSRCRSPSAPAPLPSLRLRDLAGLTGSLTPDQLERLPARKLIGPIHFALLDCPDDVLAGRLRARPAWRASSTEAKIIEYQRFAASLRARVRPSFDTSTASAAEVAKRVAAWVQALLPATEVPA
jgi:hypothetical protein